MRSNGFGGLMMCLEIRVFGSRDDLARSFVPRLRRAGSSVAQPRHAILKSD